MSLFDTYSISTLEKVGFQLLRVLGRRDAPTQPEDKFATKPT
jgi:hypothetical protein